MLSKNCTNIIENLTKSEYKDEFQEWLINLYMLSKSKIYL